MTKAGDLQHHSEAPQGPQIAALLLQEVSGRAEKWLPILSSYRQRLRIKPGPKSRRRSAQNDNAAVVKSCAELDPWKLWGLNGPVQLHWAGTGRGKIHPGITREFLIPSGNKLASHPEANPLPERAPASLMAKNPPARGAGKKALQLK